VVRFVHQRMAFSLGRHHSVDEVVYHGGDAVDAAKSVVKEGFSADSITNLLRGDSVSEQQRKDRPASFLARSVLNPRPAGRRMLTCLSYQNSPLRRAIMNDEYVVGSVLSILRYPVKSMMGEELTVADVMEGGLVGDRAYALIDNSTGKIASAKNPRKWARLFDCHASFIEPPRKSHPMPPVRIMLPDGSNIRSDQQNTNGTLSRFFEREVTLAETAPDSRLWRNTGQTSTDSLIEKPSPKSRLRSPRRKAVS